VQNVNRLRLSGHINHTVGVTRTRNTDLFDAVADRGHRLKIVRLGASLDFVELITRIVPRALREVAQAFERIAKEAHWRHRSIISDWI